jgi:hypothetical protein
MVQIKNKLGLEEAKPGEDFKRPTNTSRLVSDISGIAEQFRKGISLNAPIEPQASGVQFPVGPFPVDPLTSTAVGLALEALPTNLRTAVQGAAQRGDEEQWKSAEVIKALRTLQRPKKSDPSLN